MERPGLHGNCTAFHTSNNASLSLSPSPSFSPLPIFFSEFMIATCSHVQDLVNVHAQLAILHVLMHMLFTQSTLSHFWVQRGEEVEG